MSIAGISDLGVPDDLLVYVQDSKGGLCRSRYARPRIPLESSYVSHRDDGFLSSK